MTDSIHNPQTYYGTIAAAGSVTTNAIDLGGHTVFAFVIPATPLGTALTFQVGDSNGSFYPLYDSTGTTRIMLNYGTAGSVVVTPTAAQAVSLQAVRYMKIETSGTQSAEKVIEVLAK